MTTGGHEPCSICASSRVEGRGSPVGGIDSEASIGTPKGGMNSLGQARWPRTIPAEARRSVASAVHTNSAARAGANTSRKPVLRPSYNSPSHTCSRRLPAGTNCGISRSGLRRSCYRRSQRSRGSRPNLHSGANARGRQHPRRWRVRLAVDEAAAKTRRQNAFDDFVAAASWLVAAGYTTPDQIAARRQQRRTARCGRCAADPAGTPRDTPPTTTCTPAGAIRSWPSSRRSTAAPRRPTTRSR